MKTPLLIEESWDIEFDTPYASFTCPLDGKIRGHREVLFAMGKGEVIAFPHRTEEQTTRVTVELIWERQRECEKENVKRIP